MREAEVDLLEARLRLAEASKPSGSLSYLNSQLLNTSLEKAEKTARLEKANSLFEDVEEYPKIQPEALYRTPRRKLQAAVSNKQSLLRDLVGYLKLKFLTNRTNTSSITISLRRAR